MVKKAAGSWIQVQPGRAGDRRPLHRRIAEQLLEAMRSGRLTPGTRLPSARQLARDWGISRGTVDEAFAQLQADGHLVRRVGRGSFVAQRPPPAAPAPPPRREANQATRSVLARLQPIADDPSDRPLHGLRGWTLRPQIHDVSQFPLPLWRRLVGQALQEPMRERLSYGAAAGAPELREALAQHLALARGHACRAQQIVITDSTTQTIGIVAQVLLERGADVCVPDPGHVSVARTFALLHHRVHGMPVDDDGVDVDAARRRWPRPALIIVSPTSQYPLGARLSPPRRQALLDWARDSGAWVLEYECASEIHFDHAQPPPLASQDRDESVLLMASLSAVMYPSLRLAYLVVPERLTASFAAVRGFGGDHSPEPTQLATARFIADGHLAAHLRRLREAYGARRDALLRAVAACPTLRQGLVIAPSGINLGIRLPARWPDQALLARLAADGVAPGALSAHAMAATPGAAPTALNGLVCGFGADEPAAIGAAIGRVAAALASG